MQVRNPRFNRHGTIDVEINHPELGIIPFTASPKDPHEFGRKLYEVLLAAGNIAPYEG